MIIGGPAASARPKSIDGASDFANDLFPFVALPDPVKTFVAPLRL